LQPRIFDEGCAWKNSSKAVALKMLALFTDSGMGIHTQALNLPDGEQVLKYSGISGLQSCGNNLIPNPKFSGYPGREGVLPGKTQIPITLC
jgi:hypothetical protein